MESLEQMAFRLAQLTIELRRAQTIWDRQTDEYTQRRRELTAEIKTISEAIIDLGVIKEEE